MKRSRADKFGDNEGRKRTGAFSFRAGKRSRKGSFETAPVGWVAALGVLTAFIDVAAPNKPTNKNQPLPFPAAQLICHFLKYTAALHYYKSRSPPFNPVNVGIRFFVLQSLAARGQASFTAFTSAISLPFRAARSRR